MGFGGQELAKKKTVYAHQRSSKKASSDFGIRGQFNFFFTAEVYATKVCNLDDYKGRICNEIALI